jgi:hypothetical protein
MKEREGGYSGITLLHTFHDVGRKKLQCNETKMKLVFLDYHSIIAPAPYRCIQRRQEEGI